MTNAPYPVLGVIFGKFVQAHQTGQVATFTHLLVDGVWYLFGFFPFAHVRFDLGIYPFPDFYPEGSVGKIEVR